MQNGSGGVQRPRWKQIHAECDSSSAGVAEAVGRCLYVCDHIIMPGDILTQTQKKQEHPSVQPLGLAGQPAGNRIYTLAYCGVLRTGVAVCVVLPA